METKQNDPIDVQRIRDLAQIVKDMGLEELRIEDGVFAIRIKRPACGVSHEKKSWRLPEEEIALPSAMKPSPSSSENNTLSGFIISSPMVGTVYCKPSAEEKPFVEEGSTVKKGDKLLLIEAMKTFNEIVAPRDGTVKKILVSDNQPVEYGETLLIIT